MQMRNENTLYVVGYAHLDTQWRWAYPQVIRDYIPETLYGNFRLIEKYPNYVFNFSGSRRYQMMKEYYPEAYEKLKGYIAAGRWFPCGSSVDECDVNVPSSESLIRQVLYGNHYFEREFGKSSVEFMIPDCFGFPASMPCILDHCGIKGFSTQKLSWGSAMGIPFNVGVWEGLDGSSIVVSAFNPGAYVGKVTEDLSQSPEWLKRIMETGDKSGAYVDYHYFGTGDTGGAPVDSSVEWIEKSVSGTGSVRVVSGSAEQMFLDLTDEQIAKLPRYKGDLLLTQHSSGSVTSQAYMKKLNHDCEKLADAAERAAVSAGLLRGLPYPSLKLEKAWYLTLGSQMHDILPGTSLPVAYNYSWNDNILALNHFADVLETSVEAVAAGLDTSSPEGQNPDRPLVVYNPLNVARQDIVSFETQAAEDGVGISVTGPDGQRVPAQTQFTGMQRVRVSFLADVPPLSYSVYRLQYWTDEQQQSSELKVSESTLENAAYKVSLNAAGDVASIFDKRSGRELLAEPHRLAFIHDQPGYWPAWNVDWDDQSAPPVGYVDGAAEIRISEKGPARVALEVSRQARGSKFVTTISLASGRAGERVEFHNRIDWLTPSCSLKAVFPLTAKNPLATYNWEVSTIQRPTNHEKQYEVPAHQWFDLTDASGSHGATVLCPSKYGSDKPSDNTLRLTLLRTPGPVLSKEGQVRYDYADQCSQDWGRHEISYALVGHQGSPGASGADWQAYSFDQPLLAFETSGHPGSLGRQYSLLSIDNPRIRVLALKKAEDDDSLVIRMVNMDAQPQAGVKLAFAAPIINWQQVDGQERPTGGNPRLAGPLESMEIDFGPYQLQTYKISLQSGPPAAAPAAAPLALPFDTVAASRDGELNAGGFDPDGRSLAAEELPAVLDDAGMQFTLAPAGNNSPNAVSCRGQQIALPGGAATRLCFVAAASPAAPDAEFKVDGQSRRISIQDWGGFLGQWDSRTWQGESPEIAFEWAQKLTGIRPGYTRRDPVAWYASHRHISGGRNEIYQYSYLYRYSLDIPAGARTLTLPDNPAIKLFSMNAVSNPLPDCRPAQPLYDMLEGHPEYSFDPPLDAALGRQAQ
ncbi:alpha-mannosidase [bacterium]|nr:alpha-mannosidase [bacterium]